MIEAISAARGYAAAEATKTQTAGSALGEGARAFAELFDQADAATSGFAAGTVDAQSVVEAIAQAETALQTAITVRDRIVTAYQEILRMPL